MTNTEKLPVIHFNCKYFLGSKPCFPNKEYGVFCGGCKYYEPDESLTEDFPSIGRARAIPDGKPARILIIKLDASGDVLRTTSLLPSLKSAYPESFITWITLEKAYELLKDNSFIDEIYFADAELAGFYEKEFDIAINLDSGVQSCEVMNRSSAKVKYGFYLTNTKPYPLNSLACEWYLMGVDDNLKRANRKTYHQIIHEICGIRYSGSKPILKVTDEINFSAGQMQEKHGLKKSGEFTLINLGGGRRWQNKKWTKEGYARTANHLARSRRGTGLIAGEDDAEFYEQVSALTDQNVTRFGYHNTLKEFISAIYLSDKVLTSDSLGMHIATALGKYTVVVVGPTSCSELDVFDNGTILRSTEMECKCFYESKCKYDENCMTTLRAEMVIDALG